MRIDGCVALVSGGASGLGRATALALADRGARVVVTDLRALETDHPAITSIPADVTDGDAIGTVVAEAAAIGPLRIVVTCAGIATPGRLLSRGAALDLEAFRRVLEVNVTGTVNVLSRAAEVMVGLEPIDGERGVALTTASVAAYDGQVGQVAYAASKAAVAGMTLPLARDLAEHQVRVVSLAPGMFATPLLDGLPPAAIASLGQQVPHPSRVGRPEEFASLVTHVVENPMLNGEVIRIDGAIRMAPR